MAGNSSSHNADNGAQWFECSNQQPIPGSSSDDAIDPIGQYFYGPQDTTRHSKWPTFLRVHGSVVPAMILPLTLVTSWATCITCVHMLVHPIGIDSVLLTVLGFVVGLTLSFRGATAYERFNEGRKYWAQLSSVTSSLARLIWINTEERPERATGDLLSKISFCNMLVALAFALKHRMRFEPFIHYNDLFFRVKHLRLIAHEAESRDWTEPSFWRIIGMFFSLPMAFTNPRELIKNPKKPLGNIPLEIHSACNDFIKSAIDNGTFKIPACQTQAYNLLTQVNDILAGSERVLNTPMPLAYSIALAQITWVYILILPFQLVGKLHWITIPATVFAAYIILGLAIIGREIENPFGEDVNDLALDGFCNEIENNINVIMNHIPGSTCAQLQRSKNCLLYPSSSENYDELLVENASMIRGRLAARHRKSR